MMIVHNNLEGRYGVLTRLVLPHLPQKGLRRSKKIWRYREHDSK